MSRWRSPHAAAKRAERARRELEQRRKEKRQTWLLVVGVAVVSLGLCIADYFWIRSQARQRHERRHQHHQKQGTNNPSLQTNQNQTGDSLPERKP